MLLLACLYLTRELGLASHKAKDQMKAFISFSSEAKFFFFFFYAPNLFRSEYTCC